MQKYIEYEDFFDLLAGLKPHKQLKVYTENEESVGEYCFKKTSFKNNEIILYDSPQGGVGIIQDCAGVFTYEDFIENAWDLLEDDGDNKVFVKV